MDPDYERYVALRGDDLDTPDVFDRGMRVLGIPISPPRRLQQMLLQPEADNAPILKGDDGWAARMNECTDCHWLQQHLRYARERLEQLSTPLWCMTEA